MTRENAINTH